MNYTFAQAEAQVKQILEDHNTQGFLVNQMTLSTQLIGGDLFLNSLHQNYVASDIESYFSITLTAGNIEVIQTHDNINAFVWVTYVLVNS